MGKKLEIAKNILDIDHRQNAGGLKPLKLWLGYIEGIPFKRSSAWWVTFKVKTEPPTTRKIKPSLISNRMACGSGWTQEEATGAYIGESLRQYRQRLRRNEKSNYERINELFDFFNYRPVI